MSEVDAILMSSNRKEEETVGYYVNGTVEIVATEEQMVHAALEVPNIINQIDDWTRNSVQSKYNTASGNVIERALDASGFEQVDTYRNDGKTTHYGTFSGIDTKFVSEFVGHLAAATHMDITGKFTGEDDERWGWEKCNGRLDEIAITDISAAKLANLENQAAAVEAIKQLLNQNDTVLAAGVRAILAAQA